MDVPIDGYEGSLKGNFRRGIRIEVSEYSATFIGTLSSRLKYRSCGTPKLLSPKSFLTFHLLTRPGERFATSRTRNSVPLRRVITHCCLDNFSNNYTRLRKQNRLRERAFRHVLIESVATKVHFDVTSRELSSQNNVAIFRQFLPSRCKFCSVTRRRERS